MRYAIAAPIAPVMLAAGCAQQQDAVYAMPMAEAQRVLAQTGLPPLVFGTVPPAFEVRAETPSRIAWIVKQNGAELMRYVAELEPVDERSTRVRLALVAPTSGRFGNVEQRLAANKTVRDLYMAAMTERIASALERRPMNMSGIYRATSAAALANIGSINARMDRAAAIYERRDRENIEKAYRDEAAGIAY
jgi:hypothetical protein